MSVRPNETERAIADALCAVWADVENPPDELAGVFAAERERLLLKFERLLQPIGGEVERKVVSAGALRAAIRKVRMGG